MFPGGRERTRAIGLYTAVSIGGSAVGLIRRHAHPMGLLAVGPVRQRADRGRCRGAPGWRCPRPRATPGGSTWPARSPPPWAWSGWSMGSSMPPRPVGAAETMASFASAWCCWPHSCSSSRGRGADHSAAAVRRPRADRSYVARLFMVAGMFGMFFFLTQFLQGILGYSALKTGFAFLPLSAMVFVGRPSAPRWPGSAPAADDGRPAARRWACCGSPSSRDSTYVSCARADDVLGIGNGLAFVPLTTTSLDGVRPPDAGAASGLVNVMQQVGGSLGLAILVTVFGTATRNAIRHPRRLTSPRWRRRRSRSSCTAWPAPSPWRRSSTSSRC